MQSLIAYWKAKLQKNRWVMAAEDVAMVDQTIKALQELKKLRETNQVEREAEIVRTVKQLESAKKG